ncbi:conserved hypothetical protein [Methanocella paludicola SANAE]|uniref:B box-type domain-containing protein n=1 Tax=Methanocella paludicola (strain DSM 17711 / JCM 13418 / NBRC 101707 / SANAE) TaxID=304371 RepID=D1YYB2_METPS|nr:hypothetical protein [Methanocella paludicola]BAI61434.1 conserved hypothetical protein [Methanocella paludicola SANAE]
MKCYVHPDIDAVGTCTNCGKTVCSGCALEMNGKLICKSCIERMATQPSSQPPVQPAAQPAAQPVPQPTAPPVAPVAAAAPAAPGRKEPLISLILSFFFPGLGQIYNGQMKKGIILIVAYLALWIGMFIVYFAGTVVTMGVGALCCLPVLLVPMAEWVYGMYDAYKVANMINRGEPTKDWLS